MPDERSVVSSPPAVSPVSYAEACRRMATHAIDMLCSNPRCTQCSILRPDAAALTALADLLERIERMARRDEVQIMGLLLTPTGADVFLEGLELDCRQTCAELAAGFVPPTPEGQQE